MQQTCLGNSTLKQVIELKELQRIKSVNSYIDYFLLCSIAHPNFLSRSNLLYRDIEIFVKECCVP